MLVKTITLSRPVGVFVVVVLAEIETKELLHLERFYVSNRMFHVQLWKKRSS